MSPGIIGPSSSKGSGFSLWYAAGFTIVYVSGSVLIVLGLSVSVSCVERSRATPMLEVEQCCVRDIAVPWKDDRAEVDEGSWSMLSRFPVVNNPVRSDLGQTTPSSSNARIASFPRSVDSCMIRS